MATQTELYYLKQTESLTSYIDRMTQLTQILNIAAGEKLHLFTQGFKPHLLEVLLMHQSVTYR